MATKYTFNFTDTNTPPFDLQAYAVNGLAVPSADGLIPGAVAADTTLKLYGKGRKEYGEGVLQNMIYMLENFTNSTRPHSAIEGQLWYNNYVSVGSPPVAEQLFIRNATGTGADLINDWDAVILATGTSAMTGELILSSAAAPVAANAAVPLQYVDGILADHAIDFDLHLTSAQNTFLDGLDINGSPILLTAADVNALSGITGNVQVQLDSKVSKTTDSIMDVGVDLWFQSGGSPYNYGEIRGLPPVPLTDNSAASKRFVLDQIGAIPSGDGVLTGTTWINTVFPAPNITNETLQLIVTGPGSPPTTINVEGISRSGHTHDAIDVPIDNSFNVSYGTNVQSALEAIDLLITGGIAPLATITVQRIFETLAAPLTVAGSPIDTFVTQSHPADDNRVSITINGVKQYAHTRGTQDIIYSIVEGSNLTGLDAGTTYDFAINVDGGGATTVTINAGSPATDISTHTALIAAINAELTGSAIAASFGISSVSSETFSSHSAGSGSSIAITDPSTANTFLFQAGSPLGLNGFIVIDSASAGDDGDYAETDAAGVQILPNLLTNHVVFNYDIIIGSKIESLLYV